MLADFMILLEHFEWVTDELQSNEISISRVNPCVIALKQRLSDTEGIYEYTSKIRKDLLENLDKRFSKLELDLDLLIVSSFLDP